MTPVQHPFAGYFPWLFVALLIPAALPLLLIGDAPVGVVPRILAPLIAYALLVGAALLSLRLRFTPFSVDLASGTARIARHTVPISSFREAWRRHYTGPGQGFLIYRFDSTLGPSVRVRIAGRNPPGLTEAGRRTLARFIRAAPIEAPLTPVIHRGWERSSGADLLAELDVPQLDLLAFGVDEQTLREDAALDGRDPDAPLLDERPR